jgi:hypothetical protein
MRYRVSFSLARWIFTDYLGYPHTGGAVPNGALDIVS